LANRKYTFEMWLRDEPFHALDAPLPDGDSLPEGLTLEQFNDYVRNSVDGLIDEGFLLDDEYQKIVDYKKKTYKKALEVLAKRVVPFIDSYFAKEASLTELTVDKRIKEIDAYLDDVDSTTYNNVIRGDVPIMGCSGPICQKFLDDEDINLVLKWMYTSKKNTPITTALTTSKYYPSEYLLVYILLRERAALMAKKDVLHVSPAIIRAKYEELIKSMTGAKATRQIQHWLYDELKLTEDYVETEIGIKITEDAFRQWSYRKSKRMTKKK
jgi:hypothetical protein